MRVGIWVNGLNHQRRFAQLVQAGLKRHGIDAPIGPTANYVPSDLAITWGWRQQTLKARQKRVGGRVLVMERGYIGDRFHWTSLAYDGLNGRGQFFPPDDTGDRFDRHHGDLLKSWKGGRYVLLAGQVPTDCSLEHVDYARWLRQAATSLMVHDLPVVYRPHPMLRQEMRVDLPQAPDNVEEALAAAAMVAVYNSNFAVDAVLAGVPTVAVDRGTMAYPVCGHDLLTWPPTPAREAWAARLAWCQWSPDELADGIWWELMRAGIDATK